MNLSFQACIDELRGRLLAKLVSKFSNTFGEVIVKRAAKNINNNTQSIYDEFSFNIKQSKVEIFSNEKAKSYLYRVNEDLNKIMSFTISSNTLKSFLYDDSVIPQIESLHTYSLYLGYIGWHHFEDVLNGKADKELFKQEDEEQKQPIQNYDYSEILPFIETYPNSFDIISKFVGRKFVFDKIEEFISLHTSGYFFIKGNPGIGKTSLATKIVYDNGYLFHIINAQNNGINTPKDFLENICAQLIVDKQLSFERLPENTGQNGKFLLRILNTISDKVSKDEKVVIVVDGVDELNDLKAFNKTNLLYLPDILPPNIYFILTMRDIEEQIRFPQKSKKEILKIHHDGKENIEDIIEYINKSIKDEQIQRYLQNQNVSKSNFSETLKEKSEGNFMYLKHIFQEIKDGCYSDLEFNKIPKGLNGYYRDHWEKMLALSKNNSDIRLKVIFVLSELKKPISIKFLSDIIKTEKVKTQELLNQWMQFLNYNNSSIKKYSIYHKSFLDFLRKKEIIEAVSFDLKDINEMIIDDIAKGLF